MKKSSILAFALTLCMGMQTLSCGQTGVGSDAVSQTDTTAESTVETKGGFAAVLPEKDFQDAAFRILGRSDGDMAALHAYELNTDSENGDIINDTVYRRNQKISDVYRIRYEVTLADRDEMTSLVQTSVLSGDQSYDLLWGFVGTMTSLAVGGSLGDLNTLPYVSMSSEWWNQTAKNNLTVNGKLLLAFCDIPFTSMLYTHCLFMNRSAAADYGTDNIYDTVKNGKWTIDELLRLTADTAKDVDGNSAFDEKDFYGFMSSHGALGIFSTGADASVLSLNKNNEITLQVMSDKWQSIVEKAYRMAYDNNSSFIVNNSQEKQLAEMFANGQSLFYSGFLSDPLLYFRNMKDDFALLPLPKYDTDQDAYYTTISGGNGLLAIPKNLKNAEMTGIITEAMAIESYETLRPAVLETVMVGKLLRDDASVEIFNQIISGIRIDFAFLYTANGFGRTLKDLMMNRSTDLASYYASKEGAALKYYRDVIAAYSEN